MILVANLYRHEEKLRGQEMSLVINAYSLELYGMRRRLVKITYSLSRILQKLAKKNRLSYDHNAPN